MLYCRRFQPRFFCNRVGFGAFHQKWLKTGDFRDLLVESVIFIIGTHNLPQISSRGFPRFDMVLDYCEICLCPARSFSGVKK